MSGYETAPNLGITPLLTTTFPAQGASGINTGPPHTILLSADFRQVDPASVFAGLRFGAAVNLAANARIPPGLWISATTGAAAVTASDGTRTVTSATTMYPVIVG